MTESDKKLCKCFAAVFPTMPEGSIPSASVETVGDWDSIAHVTLVETIQQDFAIRLDDAEVEHLTSFPAWSARLQHVN
jgi:acyl carrier protein